MNTLLRVFITGLLGIFCVHGAALAQTDEEVPGARAVLLAERLPCEAYNKSYTGAGQIIKPMMLLWYEGYLSGMDLIRVQGFQKKGMLNVIHSGEDLEKLFVSVCKKNSNSTLFLTSFSIYNAVTKFIEKKIHDDKAKKGEEAIITAVGDKTCHFYNDTKHDERSVIVLSWIYGSIEGIDVSSAMMNSRKVILSNDEDKIRALKYFNEVCSDKKNEDKKLILASYEAYRLSSN